MGLKDKVYFVGDWFGCWVYGYSGFGCFAGDLGYLLEIDFVGDLGLRVVAATITTTSPIWV